MLVRHREAVDLDARVSEQIPGERGELRLATEMFRRVPAGEVRSDAGDADRMRRRGDKRVDGRLNSTAAAIRSAGWSAMLIARRPPVVRDPELAAITSALTATLRDAR
jgi:hypothetical protein